jgi:hypothetical protein
MPKFVRVPGIGYPIPIPLDLQSAPTDVLDRWVAYNKDAWLAAPGDIMSGARGFGADVTEAAGLLQRGTTGGDSLHASAERQRSAAAGAPRLGVADSFKYGIGEGFSNLADQAQQSLGYIAPAIAASAVSPAAGIGAMYAGHVGSNVSESTNAGVPYQDVNGLRAAAAAIPQTALDYGIGIGLMRGVKLPKGAGHTAGVEMSAANPLPARTFNPYADAAKRVALTGVYEGTSEAGQDAIGMLQAGTDPTSEAGRARLLDSALAGAALGGGLGAVHNTQPGIKARAVDEEVAKRVTNTLRKDPATKDRAINPGTIGNVQELLDDDLVRVRDTYTDIAQKREKVLSTPAKEHIAARLANIDAEIARRTKAPDAAPVDAAPVDAAPVDAAPVDAASPSPEAPQAPARPNVPPMPSFNNPAGFVPPNNTGKGLTTVDAPGTGIGPAVTPETGLDRIVTGDVLPPETAPIAGALPKPSELIDQPSPAPRALPPGEPAGVMYGTKDGEILPKYAGYSPPTVEPTPPRTPVHGLRVDDNYNQPNVQTGLFGEDRFNPMAQPAEATPAEPVVNPNQVDAFTPKGRPSAAGIRASNPPVTPAPVTKAAPKVAPALDAIDKPRIEATPETKAAINEQVDIGDGVADIDDAHESLNDPDVSNQYRQRAAKFIDRWNAAYAEANPQVPTNVIEEARVRAKAAREAERSANTPVADAQAVQADNVDTTPDTTRDRGDRLSDSINDQGTVDAPLYSRGSTGSSTVRGVTDELTKLLGTDASRLMRAGRILMHDTTPADIPENARAWVDMGSVHIVPGRIPSADIRGVLLHELGVHGGMKTVFGTAVYDEILTKMRKDPGAVRAYEQALNAQDKGIDTGGVTAEDYRAGPADPVIEEEALGYYIEQLAKRPSGMWQRIKNAVKHYLADLFKVPIRGFNMSDADVLHVVKGAAKAWAQGNGPSGPDGGTRMYSRVSNVEAARAKAAAAKAAERAKNKPDSSASLVDHALFTIDPARQAINNIKMQRGTLFDRLLNDTTNYSASAERKLRAKLTMYVPEYDAMMAVAAMDQKRNADQYVVQAIHDGVFRISGGTKGIAERGTLDASTERAAGQAYIEPSELTVAKLVDKTKEAAARYGIDYHSFSNLLSQYANSLRAQSMLRRATALDAALQNLQLNKAQLEADHTRMRAGNRAIERRLAAITNILAQKQNLTATERATLATEAETLRGQRVDAVKFTKKNDADIAAIVKEMAATQRAKDSQESIATKPFLQATVDYNNEHGTSYTEEQYTDKVAAELIAKYPELEALRKMNRNILREDNKARYDAHLISREAYEANEADEYYTSWLRDMTKDGDVDPASLRVKAPQKVAAQYDNYHLNKHGSHREIGDVIENTMLAKNRLVHKALGSVAARAMVRDLTDIGVANRSPYSDMSFVPEEDKARTVAITEDGKPVLYELEDINDMAAFMGPQRVHNAFVTLIAKMAAPIRSSIILDPAFILNQPLQDAISASIATGTDTPMKMVGDILKSTSRNLSNAFLGHDSLDPTIERLAREGGITGRIDHDTGAFEAAFRGIGTTGQGLLARGWGSIKEGGRRMERMAAASDVSVRARIYDDTYAAMIKAGKSPVEANLDAMDAANNIINYRKLGAHPVISMLVAMVPFFNTQLQSLAVVMQVVAGKSLRPQDRQAAYRQLARTVTRLATMAAIYALATADNDAIANKSDEERMNNFFIPLPNGDLARIRVRSEFGWAWKLVPEQLIRAISRQGNADATAAETVKALANGFRAAYVPQGGHLGNFLPAAIKPLAEIYINKSAFNDMPVVPDSMKDLPAGEQWDNNTGEVATLIGRNSGLSPKVLDHLLRSYTGGVAVYANTMAYGLMKAATNDNRADKSLYQLPFFKTFTSSPDGTKAQKQFYDMLGEARGLAKAYKKALADGRYEDATAYRRQRDSMTIRAEKLDAAAKRMQILNEALKSNRSSDTSSYQKQLIERSLQQQIDSLAGRALR